MSIRITCPSCHTRFNVSEKFAGREGPCPKCKGMIKIPSKAEEVVVHAPEIGPKDSKGRLVLKPIGRAETNLSGVQITLIVATIVFFLVAALLIRFTYPSVNTHSTPREIVGWLAIAALAFPCALAGYAFLRDQERGSYIGKELYFRIGMVAVLYIVLWGSFWISWYAFNSRWGNVTWFTAAVFMVLAGGVVCNVCIEFEYLTGLLHHGLYFACCIIARLAAGIGIFPGALDLKSPINEAESLAWLISAIECSCMGLGLS